MSFGERLKKLRLEASYTQQALADASKLSVSSITKIETGQVQPSIETARKIAHSLAIPLGKTNNIVLLFLLEGVSDNKLAA